MTTTPNRHLLLLSLMVITSAACGPDAPAAPTYFADVQPILRANCSRCHGADPADERIKAFRLDRYVKGDDLSLDAWDYRDQIVKHAAHRDDPPMPPGYALSSRQREILDRWVSGGAPKGTRENRPPQTELRAPALPAAGELTVDQTLDLELRTWDDDADGLSVSIYARDRATQQAYLLRQGVGGGIRSLMLDTGTLASSREFELFAFLDDGFSDDPTQNGHEVVLIPRLLVDHGARGTSPSIRVTSQLTDTTITSSPATLTWEASDPDAGDTLTIDLAYLRLGSDGAVVGDPNVIATGIANSGSYAWDTSAVPAADANGPIYYRIRATVRDAFGNTRSDDSDGRFTIAPKPPIMSNLGWADVKPIFVRVCKECHGQPARNPMLEYFRIDKYNTADPEAPTNGDQGVYEVRDIVYQRMVVAKTMPPQSKPQPTASELDRVGNWILSGAPQGGTPTTDGGVPTPDGGTPTNQSPTFTWRVPSNTQVAVAAGGRVTLQWIARDPEGQPLTGRITYGTATGMRAQQINCATVTSFPNEVTSDAAALAAGSFVWSTPAANPMTFYCVRAEVSDGLAPPTIVTATKPVDP